MSVYRLRRLFMVIRFVAENGHCAVKLLNGHYSYHLMRESHLRERQFAVGALIDGVAETVGAADDEREVFAGRHLFLQIVGEFDRAEFTSVLVQQKNVHGGAEELQNEIPFSGFYLVLGERFGVLEIGQHDDLKRHIVLEPLLVFIDERGETRVTRLPCK